MQCALKINYFCNVDVDNEIKVKVRNINVQFSILCHQATKAKTIIEQR